MRSAEAVLGAAVEFADEKLIFRAEARLIITLDQHQHFRAQTLAENGSGAGCWNGVQLILDEFRIFAMQIHIVS